MPLLNPAAVVLSSPMLLDTFNVIRRVETEDSSGIAHLLPTATVGVYGVVKPIGDRLDRRAEEDSDMKDLRIFTKFALRGETRDGVATNWKPDLVFWKGNNYLVIDVRDYGNYGIGFVAAECNLFEAVSMPPQVNSGLGNSGTLQPFVPPPLTPTGKIQVYIPTIISATQATIPITVTVGGMLLFRNGQLQVSPGDFALSGQTVTFVVPLKGDDTLAMYA